MEGIDIDPANLVGVVERLRRARNRTRAMLMVESVVWAGAAGLASLVIAELVRRMLPQLWHNLFGIQGVEAAALIGFAVALSVLVGGSLAAVLLTPEIDTLARRADSRFGLTERVSTALEAGRRLAGDQPSAVVAALINDAAHRTQLIDPAKLANFRVPRITLAIPLAAMAFALVVATVPEGALPQPGSHAGLDEALTEPQRRQAALDFRRVADLVDEQAARRSDSYMKAVANSLRNLGERLANAPEISRADLLSELDALVDHAAAAGREWRGETGQRIPELIDALSKFVGRPQTGPGPENGAAQRASLPDKETGDQPTAATPGGEDAPGSDLDAMLAELEGRQTPATGSPDPDGAQPRVVPDYMKVAEAQNVARSEAAQNVDGAQLIGPSPDAREGDSLLAGEGTDAIGTDPAAPVLLSFETTSELVLEAADTGGGRRLKLEIEPNARLTEITEESLGNSAQAWRRTAEGQVARYSIGFDDREAVSRYLRALMGQSRE